MTSGTFRPTEEHLGPFQKPTVGTSPNIKHLGFTESAQAIYVWGNAIVDDVNKILPKAEYAWRSVNVFTGVDSNLASFVDPVKDIATVIKQSLTLIREVMVVIKGLSVYSVNLLKVIIDNIFNILTEILNILNPAISGHLLVVPPKLGFVGNIGSVDIAKEDNTLTVLSKKSEAARRNFVSEFTKTVDKLPTTIKSSVEPYSSEIAGPVTGHTYLLNTIKAKLNDKTDMAKPSLTPTSHWAGVGLFLGTNSITEFIKNWTKLSSIFSRGVNLPKAVENLPPIPIIVKQNLTLMSGLENTVNSTEANIELNPEQGAVIVRPLLPSNYIRGGLTYDFQARHVYVLKTPIADPSDRSGISKFITELDKILDDKSATLSIIRRPGLHTLPENILLYSYMQMRDSVLSKFSPSGSSSLQYPYWTKVLEYNLDPGSYMMQVVDYYKLEGGNDYLPLRSEFKSFKILDTQAEQSFLDGLVQLRYTRPGEFIDPTAKNPHWVVAQSAISLFPTAIQSVVNLSDLLRNWLNASLDDALDWLSELLISLDKYIAFIARIVDLIDQLLTLLSTLANMNSTLGLSAMSFTGMGTTDTLYKVFEEYLDPNINNSTVAEADITEETEVATSVFDITEYKNFMKAVKDDASVLLRDEPDPDLDTIGNSLSIEEMRKKVQDAALENLRTGKDPAYPSISRVISESYNKSPTFTPDMTTAAIIIMAHSQAAGRVELLLNLIDFLFSEEEKATSQTVSEELGLVGLLTDLPVLYPITTDTQFEATQKALFTDSMELTTDTKQSPFNFCPSDED